MKQKLLTVACMLTALTSAHAQTDVTDNYLQNPGFEKSPVFDGTSTGSKGTESAAATSGSTLVNTNPNVFNISGWTTMTSSTQDYARTFTMPYAATLYVASSETAGNQEVKAPANGSSVQTDNSTVFFAEANWCSGETLGVKQTVTLPAGVYKMTFDTYVSTSLANASSLCGVKYGTEAKYKWPAALNTWTNNSIVFVLDKEQEVQLSLGYTKTGNAGGPASAFMFADNVKLYKMDANATDYTSKIVNPKADNGSTGWKITGGINTEEKNLVFKKLGQTGIFEPSNWGAGSWDGYDKQTITGLPNGLYRLQAATQSEEGVRAWLAANDDNSIDLPANGTTLGTIAEDGTEVEAGKGLNGWTYGSVSTLVTDGTLNIAFMAKATAQYKWANAWNFTLKYYEGTAALALQVALQEAIDKAQGVVNNGGYAHTTSLEEAIASARELMTSTDEDKIQAAIENLDKVEKNLAVSNATLDKPYAMTVKNGDLASTDGWTQDGGTFSFVTNNENPGANVKRPYCETWVAAPANTQKTARKFYQTVADCPRGAYELKAAVTAVYQVSGADISQNNGVYLYIKDGDNITRTPCKTGNAAQYFSVIVNHESDGDLEIGLQNESATRVNWIAFDNFSLNCYGEGTYEALAKKNYEAALAAAKALDNAAVTGQEKTNLEAAIAAAPATAEEYVNAKSDLQIATINYSENEVVYNELQAVKAWADKDFPYASAEKKTAVEAIVATSAAEAVTMKAQATSAVRALYESNALAEGVEGAENCTSKVENADFSNGNTGWESSQSGGNLQTLNGETWTKADGNKGGYYYDYYNGAANNQHATRTIENLTPGKYILTLKVRALAGFNIVFTANGNTADVEEAGNSGNVFDRGWNDYTIPCSVDQTGKLAVEVANVVSPNKAGWFGFGDLRLVRLGDFDALTIDEAETYVPEKKNANVTLKRTLTAGWNAVVLPVDMTAAEAKTIFNATEVKTFAGVTTTDAGAVLKFADAEAIEAGKPVMIRLAAEPAENTYAIGNVCLSDNALTAVEQTSADGATFAFTGIYEPQTVQGPFAYINDSSIYNYKEGESATSKAFRAYFCAVSAAAAQARVIGIAGIATAVDNVTVKEQPADSAELRDVLGRRVTTTVKGRVYISNGKTFIAK